MNGIERIAAERKRQIVECPIKDRVTFPICVAFTLEQAEQCKDLLEYAKTYSEDGFTKEISSVYDSLCCEIDKAKETQGG